MKSFFFLGKQLKPEDIIIRYDKNISSEEILNLYMAVGWQYRNATKIEKSIINSFLVTSAWYNNVLVGIARTTGDGVFNATIWDFAVHPAYQKQGIGKLIMNSMLMKLDDCNIPLITLYTAYTKKNFYSKLGFELDQKKVIGMYKFKNNK